MPSYSTFFRWGIFLLSLSLSFPVQATEFGEAFATGLQAYQKGDYAQAIEYYEQSLSTEMKSAEAYNNLGLAYYHNGELGYAILNFERAIRQNSYLRDAQHNLKAAKQYLDVDIKAHQGFWMFRAWNRMAGILSSNSWVIIFWIFLFLAAAGFIVWYNLEDPKLRAWGFKAGVGLLILALLPMIWGFQASSKEYHRDAVIILSPRAGIRSAPSINGEDIIVVGAGVKAHIMEQQGEWNRIRLENGVLGWMQAKLMERI